jgi:hypothetical protein
MTVAAAVTGATGATMAGATNAVSTTGAVETSRAGAEAGAEAAALAAAEGLAVAVMLAMCSRSVWVVRQQLMCGRGTGMPAGSWTWVRLVARSAVQMRCSGLVAAATVDALGSRSYR